MAIARHCDHGQVLFQARISAGLLMYRIRRERKLLVLLAHPGGPYFTNKAEGARTIMKGEIEPG
jgi:predicted NUDIX family NTP pyrophosphohydrolase